jgi:ribosome-associated toxin RatA of RatAB toxin-antitoxin module
MREVHRSAIVPYAADAMFALVADLESYPQFVPGCTGSSVLSHDAAGLVASLSLSKGPFVSTFSTRNSAEPPRRMTMELLEGPFRSLHGEWLIEPLGEKGCASICGSGSSSRVPPATGCWVRPSNSLATDSWTLSWRAQKQFTADISLAC